MALVIISLDFEMRWGVHDIYGLDFEACRENFHNLQEVIPATLKLLQERSLQATWATVGAIGLSGWSEYLAVAPPAPNYKNKKLAISPIYSDLDPKGELHFAPELIRQIISTPGQELGSHSFSHAYFREPGITELDFVNEMSAVRGVWKDLFNIEPVSLVFPKNQSAFIHLMPDFGLRIWRGNENAWYFDQNTESSNTYVPRVMRLMESISPWVRRAATMEEGLTRASLFIRFNLPDVLWKIHMKRVERELKFIDSNKVFHIWWHPENLGKNTKQSISRLSQLLDIISAACLSDRVTSVNMAGLLDLSAKNTF